MYCINLSRAKQKAYVPVKSKSGETSQLVSIDTKAGQDWIESQKVKKFSVVLMSDDRELFSLEKKRDAWMVHHSSYPGEMFLSPPLTSRKLFRML